MSPHPQQNNILWIETSEQNSAKKKKKKKFKGHLDFFVSVKDVG